MATVLALATVAAPGALAVQEGGQPEPAGWPAAAAHRDVEEVATRTTEHVPVRRVGPARQVRRQPVGALSGKIVYVGAGHGWTYDSEFPGSGVAWFTQRGNVEQPVGSGNFLKVVEDHGNLDQATLFAFYVWNAGGTVVPTRPVGWQRNEVVLDNDDTSEGPDGQVVYSGTWSDSASTPFYSKPPDSPRSRYRFASAVDGDATATAEYNPDIPEAGWYPVYTWVLDSGNRINQEYEIHHAGGVTATRVNHRAVGKGWVWLGSYWFEAGSNIGQKVVITNSKEPGDAGSVVIADAIRLGNGMGDLDYGEGSSGFPREEEAGRYWAVASQAPASVYDLQDPDVTLFHDSDNVGTPPRMAAYMNNESESGIGDAVYVGFHTNATGSLGGALGLTNSDGGVGATPNQDLLAEKLGREINEDFRQLDRILFPSYPEWANRTVHVLDRSDLDFGEIRDSAINNEMDATIIEVAFHDNANDVIYLRDPLARRLAARSVLQGLIRYFEEVDGIDRAMPPDEPRNLRAIVEGSDVVLHWEAPPAIASTFPGTPGNIGGDQPTSYAVYASSNGLDQQFLAEVPGTSHTITGLAPGETIHVQVSAVNTGGESFPSNAASARPNPGLTNVLIVDGFDRQDYLLSPDQTVSGIPGRSSLGTFTRVIPYLVNDFTYATSHARALAASAFEVEASSATNDAVLAGDVLLGDHDVVVWLLGEESTADETFSAAEQALVASHLASGGHLIVSGAEIGWDLGRSSRPQADRDFYANVLGAGPYATADDAAGVYSAIGASGTFLEALSFEFSDGSGLHPNIEFADIIRPGAASTTVLLYSTGEPAAIHKKGTGGAGDVLLVGFPLESIVLPTPGASQGPLDAASLGELLGATLREMLGQDTGGWMLLGD